MQQHTSTNVQQMSLNIDYVLTGVGEAVSDAICTSPTNLVQYQLFGVDVQPDQDGTHPVVLEFNKGPDLSFKDQRDQQLKEGLAKDMVDMVMRVSQRTPQLHAIESGYRCIHVRNRQ
jgi:hypothetical protein